MIIFPFTYFIQSKPFEEFDLRKEKQRVLSEYDLDKYDNITKNDILDTFEALEDRGFYEDCLKVYTLTNLKILLLGELNPYRHFHDLKSIIELSNSKYTYEFLKDRIHDIFRRCLGSCNFTALSYVVSYLEKIQCQENSSLNYVLKKLETYCENIFDEFHSITNPNELTNIDGVAYRITSFNLAIFIKRLSNPSFAVIKKRYVAYLNILIEKTENISNRLGYVVPVHISFLELKNVIVNSEELKEKIEELYQKVSKRKRKRVLLSVSGVLLCFLFIVLIFIKSRISAKKAQEEQKQVINTISIDALKNVLRNEILERSNLSFSDTVLKYTTYTESELEDIYYAILQESLKVKADFKLPPINKDFQNKKKLLIGRYNTYEEKIKLLKSYTKYRFIIDKGLLNKSKYRFFYHSCGDANCVFKEIAQDSSDYYYFKSIKHEFYP